MPILTSAIERDGAIVEAAVGVSGPRAAALRNVKRAIPSLVIVPALLDTGASCTCVDPTVLAKLGITPTGTTKVHTPSTGNIPHICNQFDVALLILMNGRQVHVPSMVIPVLESDLKAQGIQAIIGRDVLNQAVLVYDGPRGVLTLAF